MSMSFYTEEVEFLARNFDVVDDVKNDYDTAYAVSGSSNISESDDGKRSESMDSSKSFFLEPNLLESLLFFFIYQLIAVLACIRLVYIHVT